jgi:hypothetical protein
VAGRIGNPVMGRGRFTYRLGVTETALIRTQADDAPSWWDGAPAHGADPPDGTHTEPFRPTPPASGLGVRLRRVVGINEAILDWVPEERPRYTWQGAIVLNTAILAGISMLILLSRTELSTWLMVPVALIWAGMIFTFDAWLVSSTHGVVGRAKLAIYLPRILISILMGAVIAEPLLLAVFAPAIHTEVNQQRKQSLDDYENRLRACNPVAGTPAANACTDGVNVENPLISIRNDLTRKTELRDRLAGQVRTINAELARREAVSRAECNGTKIRRTTTGVVGEGPNCKRNRTEADRYRGSSGLDEREADITRLSRDIVALTADEASAGRTYAAAVHGTIERKMAEARNAQQRIGILDEDRALGALAATSAFVAIGSWLLRILLIVVDCLPVLTKLLGRSTTYDALLSRQSGVTDRLHQKFAAGREQRFDLQVDLEMHRNEDRYRRALEQIKSRD